MRCRLDSIHAPVPTTATTNSSKITRTDVTIVRPQRRLRRGLAGRRLGGSGGRLRSAGTGGGRRPDGGGGGGVRGDGCGDGGRRYGGGGGGGRWIGSRRITCDGSGPGLGRRGSGAPIGG